MAPIADDAERYRRDILRHLQQEYQKAEQEKARADKKTADLRQAINRAQAQPPRDDLYPRCFYHDGVESEMRSAPHPDPTNWDRWRCRTCEYEMDEALRS